MTNKTLSSPLASVTFSRMTKFNHKPVRHLLLCVLATSYNAATLANGATDTNGSDSSTTESIKLNVRPITCVALHKGQTCHKNLIFSWSTLPAGRYCLHSSDNLNPLRCWQHNAKTSLTAGYKSAREVRYELRVENSDTPLAHAVVKTSWVYRTSRRSSSGWRLF